MSSESNELLLTEGLVISERYRKNKETGEKKFYPIGSYSIDKARSQYFFLAKSLQEMVVDEHLSKIDKIIFKPHNNVPELLIAFPDRKDTTGYLIFAGYKKSDITFINNDGMTDSPCPYSSIPSKNYHLNMMVEDDLNFYCEYCNTPGVVPKSEEEAAELAVKAGIDSHIKSSSLVGKFIHSHQGIVHIINKSDIEVEDFLDVFAVKIPDGGSVRFLMTKTFTIQEVKQPAQFLVEFTHHFDSKPNVKISKINERRFTTSQYSELVNKAKEYNNYLAHMGPNESTMTFSFPDIYDEKDSSPFSVLKNVVKQEEVEEDNE